MRARSACRNHRSVAARRSAGCLAHDIAGRESRPERRHDRPAGRGDARQQRRAIGDRARRRAPMSSASDARPLSHGPAGHGRGRNARSASHAAADRRDRAAGDGRPGGPPLADVVFQVFEDDPDAPQGRRELMRSAAARPSFSLPAGTYYVVARHGAAEARERLTRASRRGRAQDADDQLRAALTRCHHCWRQTGFERQHRLPDRAYRHRTSERGHARHAADRDAQPRAR